MMITFTTIIYKCFIVLILYNTIYGYDNNNNNKEDEFKILENRISELQSYLKKIGKGDGTETSNYLKVEKSISEGWAQLGGLYLLRQKPLTYETKTIALNCYNQAIIMINDEDDYRLIAGNKELEIEDAIKLRYEYILSWSLQKGILLSQLEKYNEAISIYDEIILYIQIVDKKKFDINKNFAIDKSAVLRLKADILMNYFNDSFGASKLFNESVSINPCDLDVYRLYITALKDTELDGYTVNWLSTMNSLIEISSELLDEEYNVDENCLKNGELISSLDYFELKKTSSLTSPDFANTANMARSGIYWAIFEAADKANDVEIAWEYLKIARSLDLESYGELSHYSLEKAKSDANSIVTLFTKEHWPDPSHGIGSNSKTPVFIVGFLRSGISLLENLLLSHINITTIGTNDIMFKQIIQMQEDMTEASKTLNKNNKDDLKKMMISSKNIIDKKSKKILKNMKIKAKKYISLNNSTQNIKHITNIIDKTITNYKNIARIHLIFPNAIILHVTRDPLDTLLSCYSTKFTSPDTIWTLDVNTLIVEYTLYLEIMQHYRNIIPRPDRLVDISYEALVTNTENVIKNIITKKLDLKWDALAYEAHIHNKVKRNIHIESIGRWRKYSKKMSTMIDMMTSMLPRLVELKALPSITSKNKKFKMNWDLSIDYDYNDIIKKLKSLKANDKNNNNLLFDSISQMRAEKSQTSISRFVQTSSYEDMVRVIKKYDEDIKELDSNTIIDISISTRKKCSMIVYRSRLLGAMGRVGDAIEGFDEALTIMEKNNIESIPGEDIKKGRILAYKADVLSLIPSRLNEAANIFQQLLESNSKEYNLYYNIAVCYDDMIETVHDEKWYSLFNQGLCSIAKDGSLSTIVSVATNDLASPTSSLERFDSLKWLQILCSSSSSSEDVCSNYEFIILHLGCNSTDSEVMSSSKSSSLLSRHLGVYWSLYLSANRLGAYSLAWKFLNIAQQIELSINEDPYNIATSFAVVSNIKDSFKKGFWPDKYIGSDSKMPVFIVGFLRSGANLLENLLGAHKNIIGIGDDSIFNKYVPYVQKNLTQLIGKRDLSRQHVLLQLMNFVNENAEEVLKVTKSRAAKLKKHYKTIDSSNRKDNVHRVIDKLLVNYRNIALIHLLFPNAIILHVVRDPLDTLLSCYTKRFGNEELLWTMDANNLVAEYAAYLELMAHFHKVIPRKNRLIDISYEALVINPERVLRDIIIDKMQLPWDPNVLNFHKNDRIKRKIYTDAVGRWKLYSNEMEVIIKAMKEYIPNLMKLRALPHITGSNEEPVMLNWKFSKEYDYMSMLMNLL